MKKIVLMMVALLSMTAVQAQENDNNQNPQQFRGPRQMTPEQMTERMSNDLKLTDDQKTKVLALNYLSIFFIIANNTDALLQM